jgi:membrane-associated phospholipid phosphatase
MTRTVLYAAIAAWLLLLASAITLSLLAAANDTFPGDEDITEWVQGWPEAFEPLADAARALTGDLVILISIGIAILLWFRGYHREALLLLGGLIVLYAVQTAVKELVDRPRPDPAVVDVRTSRTSPSFPSGHVMEGVYVYGFLIYIALILPMPRVVRGIICLSALAVILVNLAGNVYLGAHWPSDVVGGVLWALVVLIPVILYDRIAGSRVNSS